MGKRLWACLLALVCLAAPVASRAEQAQYFYLTACESCHPEEQFAERFAQLTGKDATDYAIQYYNVYHEDGRAAYELVCKGLREEERTLPLLVLEGKAYAGDSSIDAGLALRFGTDTRSADSVLWFLTATACESCRKARAAVEALPAVVPLWIGDDLVSSAVTVREVNIADDPGMASALFEAYHVPDEERFAPAVFLGGTYLSGQASIEEGLADLVRGGGALHTLVPTPTDGGSAPTILGAAAAGLAAGFNPCAISMLLLFLSMLLSLRKHPLAPGLAYLGGKLVVYLAIGLLFSRLWNEYAPAWFPLAARWLLTAIGAVLIVLNLMDAHHARTQDYGLIRNQLPTGLRGRLRGLISRSTEKGRVWLGVAACATGAVVAAGEFLCAGQLYVAVLIANANASGAALALVAYSLAFLLPSLAVLVIVSATRKTFQSSDWMLRHMPLIKLLTAVMMAAVIAYTWVIS